ncbi:MAG: hypothetical protein LC808_43230 [Actinobacteria bacterium]|nr:hypothetical protein [Actinomycetota bacterium]
MRSRRFLALPLALALTLLFAGAPAATASTTPYCGITWGSLGKHSSTQTSAPIVDARIGRHDCWDRLVIDVSGSPAPGYVASYTPAFYQVGTGFPLQTSGGAILTIEVNAPGQPVQHWSVGTHIVTPERLSAGGYRTFRDLVYGGTYAGYTHFGLGLRARLPFRIFKLAGPGSGSRLVIDVAHRW